MEDDDDNNDGGADDDLLSELMSKLQRSSITSPQELVQTFASICNIDVGLSQFFIESSGGNLQVAINLFYEYGASAAAGAGGGGGGGGIRRVRDNLASGAGIAALLDGVHASSQRVGGGVIPSSFAPGRPATGGFDGGVAMEGVGEEGDEEDDDVGGDEKALQMAIALSTGIPISDIDQMRAIEAQNAALLRTEIARTNDPFSAYGVPRQQLPIAPPPPTATTAAPSGFMSTSSSSSNSSFPMQGASGNSGDMDE
jgi:hypothetical protein